MNTMKFKVGDKVTWNARPAYGLGTVTKVGTTHYSVQFKNYTGYFNLVDIELTFASSPEEPIPDPVKMQQRAEVYDNVPGAGGMKYDGDKARMDLMLDGMPNALEQVSQILTFGAKKYADHSWQTVPNGKARYKAALLRHLTAHAKGEVNDPESGMPHLAHAACNALFILELEQRESTV